MRGGEGSYLSEGGGEFDGGVMGRGSVKGGEYIYVCCVVYTVGLLVLSLCSVLFAWRIIN